MERIIADLSQQPGLQATQLRRSACIGMMLGFSVLSILNCLVTIIAVIPAVETLSHGVLLSTQMEPWEWDYCDIGAPWTVDGKPSNLIRINPQNYARLLWC